MATVRVEIDREKARIFSLRAAEKLVIKMTSEVLRQSKVRVLENRFKTGHLYRSGRSSIRTYLYRVVGTVEYTAAHATLIHRGAKPHLIRPVRKTGLLFYYPRVGRVICFKGTVHHPGFRGVPYLTIPLILEAYRNGFLVRAETGRMTHGI